MFDRYRLLKQLKKTEQVYDKKVMDMSGDSDAIDSIMSQAERKLGQIEEKLRIVESRELELKARAFFPGTVKIRESEGLWERGIYSPTYILTEEGVEYYRAKIGQRVKQQDQRILSWAPITIGLIGAITGLVAVIATILN